MSWQESGKVLRYTNRTHAGSTATVRNAEGLVQVQVTHVGTDLARAAKAHLGIHVRTVHVNLPTGTMHRFANFLDGSFENPMR